MNRLLVVDSGAGGLTVARDIIRLLPEVSLTYMADSFYFPYGQRAPASLLAIVQSLIEVSMVWMEDANGGTPDALVLACNTASTQVLEQLREVFEVPIIGVVPAIKPAAQVTQTGVFGVLATPNTVQSRYLEQLKASFASTSTMLTYGAIGLVQLAEERLVRPASADSSFDQRLLEQLSPIFQQPPGEDIDTLVLACTHFPLLAQDIHRLLPLCTARQVQLIDSGAAVARQVQRVLQQRNSFNFNSTSAGTQVKLPTQAAIHFMSRDQINSVQEHPHAQAFRHYLIQ